MIASYAKSFPNSLADKPFFFLKCCQKRLPCLVLRLQVFPESQRVFDFHIRPLHPALGIAFPSIFFDDILGKQYGILFFYYSVNNGKIHLVFAIICRGIIFTSTRIVIRADGIVTVLKIEIGKIFTITRYFLKAAYNIVFGKRTII